MRRRIPSAPSLLRGLGQSCEPTDRGTETHCERERESEKQLYTFKGRNIISKKMVDIIICTKVRRKREGTNFIHESN